MFLSKVLQKAAPSAREGMKVLAGISSKRASAPKSKVTVPLYQQPQSTGKIPLARMITRPNTTVRANPSQYYRTPMSSSLFHRHESLLPQVSSQNISRSIRAMHSKANEFDFLSKIINHAGDFLGLTLLASLSYFFYKITSLQHEAREEPIIASAIQVEVPAYQEPDDLSQAEHGSLNNKIIGYEGKTFLKKGAKNRDALIREFVIGDALHEMYPSSQPLTLIFQDKLDDKEAQFFTLSEIKPGSVDIEDFIKAGDWQQKLDKKPLIGFEVALAMTAMMAGQQDCKYANMIITDKGTHYEAGVIDHELSGINFFKMFNRRLATHDFKALISMIRDLHSPDDQFSGEFKFGLTNDPRGQAFAEYAKQHSMDDAKLDEFYQNLSQQDFSLTIQRLEQLSTLTTLVTPEDVAFWKKELDTWQKTAKAYCKELGLTHTNSPSP